MARRSPSGTPPRRGSNAVRKSKTAEQTAALAAERQDTAFVDALSVDFVRHGASAISRLRENDPVTYMKLCASVLPKAVIDSIDPLESLTDEELLERARRLAEKAGLGPCQDPDDTGKAKKPE